MFKLAGQGADTVSDARRVLQLKVWRVKPSRFSRKARWALLAAALIFFAAFLEMRISWIQSRALAAVTRRLSFQLMAGASPSILSSANGPYDRNLGYAKLPQFLERLRAEQFDVKAQARTSDLARRLSEYSLFPVYKEKSQAGLLVLDSRGETLLARKYPQRVYERFEDIPPLVVQSLLFIENRELLEERANTRNPAVEWDRLANAVVDLGIRQVNRGHPISGGSTLATQLEKVRHSPEGATSSLEEKARQMATASLRSYLSGEDTRDARKRIVVDYLNSLPLASLPGYGEVIGFGDGLWAWFDADFRKINQLLQRPNESSAGQQELKEMALAYRQVLNMLLAIKKPSDYLLHDPVALELRVDKFAYLLEEAGVIGPRFRDALLLVRPTRRYRLYDTGTPDYVGQKAVDAVRNDLIRMLGVGGNYELNRLDLTVKSTLDGQAGAAVSDVLKQLADPAYAVAAGVTGGRLLDPDDLKGVIYSFTLFERKQGANVLRVQVDNYDQPMNVNQDTKLELGSTAKLRTLVTYLETVAELHVKPLVMNPQDRLGQWAVEYKAAASDPSLAAMLEAAMNRTYSASPGESFFTGGGLHQFENFDSKDNGRILTVREAFQRSVNLVFIRVMRDLVNHNLYRKPGTSQGILEDEQDPRRTAYLERFADMEGKEFLRKFYGKYKGLAPDESLRAMLEGRSVTPKRLAVIYRTVLPQASLEEFAAFLDSEALVRSLSSGAIADLYDAYAPERFNLNDRGYLARVHPLELWLAAYLRSHPSADLAEVFTASARERQEIYGWLFKRGKKHGQDIRIRTLLEKEAFEEIHRAWKKLGYPFPTLVPSYATAIGSSGDNPAALAELVGILVNDGMRYRSTRIQELHFASKTPFETLMERRAGAGERVLAAEVAGRVKQEMLGVVEKGTARRAFGSVVLSDGRTLPVGGKTGTGDNRIRTYASRGWEIESKAINRTASFIFFIGDRYFGTVMAYVPGSEAEGYSFTSALPVQVFTKLMPGIRPVLEATPN